MTSGCREGGRGEGRREEGGREEAGCLADSLERRGRSSQLFVLGSLARSHAGRRWIAMLMAWRRKIFDDTIHGVCSSALPEPSQLLWREKWMLQLNVQQCVWTHYSQG